jgi:antitoxin (DNA-binding transcriptional repressor) of toxin-antitoxin stability system
MKFITVRDLRTTPAQIWRDLPEEQEMIITNNGKPIALLTPLSDSDIEDTLTAVRRARAMNAVKKMQYNSLKNELSEMTMEEIEREIKETRKSKKR